MKVIRRRLHFQPPEGNEEEVRDPEDYELMGAVLPDEGDQDSP